MDESTKRGLLAAYGRLLRPLVRILIRNGVIYSEFAEVAKETFVRVGSESTSGQDSPSRTRAISGLTGLTSSEINQIHQEINSRGDSKNEQFDVIVKVLATWHTNSNFTGPYGLPLELPYSQENRLDFRTLVEGCSPTADAKAILNELLETSAVEEVNPGWHKVKTRYYMPEGSAPGGIEHLSRTIEDLANTIDHNHSETLQRNRLFERHVYTEDGIRAEDLPAFAEFAGKRAQKLLDEIDNWLTNNVEPPSAEEKDSLSTGFGIFHYIHKDQEDR